MAPIDAVRTASPVGAPLWPDIPAEEGHPCRGSALRASAPSMVDRRSGRRSGSRLCCSRGTALRDDADGYGPRGWTFVDHVDIRNRSFLPIATSPARPHPQPVDEAGTIRRI